MRKANIFGGGSRTNFNGLKFEGRTSFIKSIKNNKDFETRKIDIGYEIKFKNKKIGFYTEKNNFYKYLDYKNINWRNLISKKYEPDGMFLNYTNKTIYVIEKKYQARPGSVDEKLQTCDFKKKIYIRLTKDLKKFMKIEYIYLLNEWFDRPEYSDVKKYIHEVNCKYFINKIELEDLGITDEEFDSKII